MRACVYFSSSASAARTLSRWASLTRPARVEHPLRPWAHLGVGCASREEVDRLCAEARAEGRLLTEPVDSGYPVGYWALLSDPDGHTLELSYGQEVGLTVGRA